MSNFSWSLNEDHCKAVKDTLRFGTRVFMSQETQSILKLSNRYNLLTAKPLHAYDIGSFTIVPFKVKHDIHNLGYILISTTGEQLVFFTDTYYVRHLFPKTTHWLVECNYVKQKLDNNLYQGDINLQLRNRIAKSHMSLETLKDIFKANDLGSTKAIYLTHLSDNNSDAALMKEEIQKCTGKVVYVC